MAKYTGTALYVTYGGTVLTGEHRKFDWDYKGDVDDVTAGADVDKEYITTHRDASGSMMIVDTGTDMAGIRSVLYPLNSQTLIFAPNGTATGMPKYQCEAILTDVKSGYPYDGHTEIEFSWQKTGAWTANYELLGSTY